MVREQQPSTRIAGIVRARAKSATNTDQPQTLNYSFLESPSFRNPSMSSPDNLDATILRLLDMLPQCIEITWLGFSVLCQARSSP